MVELNNGNGTAVGQGGIDGYGNFSGCCESYGGGRGDSAGYGDGDNCGYGSNPYFEERCDGSGYGSGQIIGAGLGRLGGYG